ncbi:MAG: ABC transporter permease, partial [Candidatus Eisenbacteria bacterium]
MDVHPAAGESDLDRRRARPRHGGRRLVRHPARAPRGRPRRRRRAAGAPLTLRDLFGLTLEALRIHRLRYSLSALAITVGVAAVVLLSSIGEGTRRFIVGEMTQFGTTLVAVYPGKLETRGMPGLMGAGARKLTMDDARVLSRIPGVVGTLPVVYGSSLVRGGGRGRRVYVYGVSSEVPIVWSMDVAIG